MQRKRRSGDQQERERFNQELLRICKELGPFLVKKNNAYGDATRRIVRTLEEYFPDGIPFNQISNVYYFIQILNKLSRVAEDNDPFGEDPWHDAAGYSVLAEAKRNLEQRRRKK